MQDKLKIERVKSFGVSKMNQTLTRFNKDAIINPNAQLPSLQTKTAINFFNPKGQVNNKSSEKTRFEPKDRPNSSSVKINTR